MPNKVTMSTEEVLQMMERAYHICAAAYELCDATNPNVLERAWRRAESVRAMSAYRALFSRWVEMKAPTLWHIYDEAMDDMTLLREAYDSVSPDERKAAIAWLTEVNE